MRRLQVSLTSSTVRTPSTQKSLATVGSKITTPRTTMGAKQVNSSIGKSDSNHHAYKVFVSYSHKDKKWLDDILVFLTPLVREKGLSPWHLSVQKHGPKSRQRQARLHQLDDAAKPSGEPGGSASGDFPGLIGGTFFSLGGWW